MAAQDVINATTAMLTKADAMAVKYQPKLSATQQVAADLVTLADRVASNRLECERLAGIASGGGNGGTTTPGGGTTTPTTTAVKAMIAKLKAAALTAPVTPAAIPRRAVTVTQGSANRQPDQIPGANGAYERHWLSGNGNNGFADLNTVGTVRPLDITAPGFGGAVQFQSNDGSSAHGYIQGAGIPNYAGGDISDFGEGHYFTGRAIGFASSNGRGANLYVDELDGTGLKLVTGRQSWNGDGSYVYYDFTTSKKRAIYFRGGADGVFGEVAIKPGDLLEKFEFLDGSWQGAYMGDSWGQGGAYNTIGLSFPQMLLHMCGSRYLTGSTIGGTGYVMEQGQANANADYRMKSLYAGDASAIFTCLGINDGFNDAFVAGVSSYYDKLRAAKPNAMIVGMSLCSAENRATGTGAEVQRRNTVKAKVMSLTGPWMYLDGFDGKWYTSAGTSGGNLGPLITGNGSVASPTGNGNADTWIDNNDGRHLTETGNQGTAKYFGDLYRPAIASFPAN